MSHRQFHFQISNRWIAYVHCEQFVGDRQVDRKNGASCGCEAIKNDLKKQPPQIEFGAVEEAEVGFEPTNNGFAIRPLGPLGYSAEGVLCWLVSLSPSNG
jgi:hypothetical protein